MDDSGQAFRCQRQNACHPFVHKCLLRVFPKPHGIICAWLLCLPITQIFEHGLDIIFHFIQCGCICYTPVCSSGENKSLFGFNKCVSLPICESAVCYVSFIQNCAVLFPDGALIVEYHRHEYSRGTHFHSGNCGCVGNLKTVDKRTGEQDRDTIAGGVRSTVNLFNLDFSQRAIYCFSVEIQSNISDFGYSTSESSSSPARPASSAPRW